MKNAALFLILAISLSGCEQFVKDFVGEEEPSSEQPTQNQFLGPQLTPGAAIITGATYKTQATVGPRQQILSGTRIQATISLEQSSIQ